MHRQEHSLPFSFQLPAVCSRLLHWEFLGHGYVYKSGDKEAILPLRRTVRDQNRLKITKLSEIRAQALRKVLAPAKDSRFNVRRLTRVQVVCLLSAP